LSRTPASAGNRRTFTFATWIKRSALSGSNESYIFNVGAGSNDSRFQFNPSDAITLNLYESGASAGGVASTAVFRDFSAWYHFVLAVDTTQTVSTDRVKIYANGQQLTLSGAYPAQNLDTSFNTAQAHTIGSRALGGSYFFNGYLADIHFIDGQALTPSSFGEFDANGIWQPKAYSGTYGTNGFHLDFSDNSSATALGYDAAGSNNWTPNNLSVATGSGNDSLVDTPTSYGIDTAVGGEVRGNYAVWSYLDKASSINLVNGALQTLPTLSDASYPIVRSTIGVTSGKWYYEVVLTTKVGDVDVGIAKSTASLTSYLGSDANGWSYGTGGNKYNNGSGSAYGATWTGGDIIGVAFDADAGTLTFYKNGVSQGQAFSGLTSGPYFFATDVYQTSSPGVVNFNFGQRPFAYTAPSGFKALCSSNLPAPLITKPSEYMDVKLYTGTGSILTVSGLGFSPDFVWLKNRGNGASHRLTDTVRGATKSLFSDSTTAELNEPDSLQTFTSDGFTLGTGGGINNPGTAAVAWCWDAGSSTVTNTQGSITSSVRANPSAGFSIVTWTGDGSTSATVGHGLGVPPVFYVSKNRSATGNWQVITTAINGSMQYGFLNLTNAFGAAGQTAPTSSVLNLLSVGNETINGNNYVAYCFAPVAGYSAMGSYVGNGSADGKFVYTGFRPRWLMIKDTTGSTNYWWIYDTARDTYNASGRYLFANVSDAEQDYRSIYPIDILSNGFKVRNTLVSTNNSVFVYCAFAESPFQYARAR